MQKWVSQPIALRIASVDFGWKKGIELGCNTLHVGLKQFKFPLIKKHQKSLRLGLFCKAPAAGTHEKEEEYYLFHSSNIGAIRVRMQVGVVKKIVNG
jgi:hypothetical protein